MSNIFGKNFLKDQTNYVSKISPHPLAEQISASNIAEPDNFGMPGKSPMKPVTRMAGARLGAVGMADALAGEISDRILLPLGEKAIGATINHLADTMRNPGRNQLTASVLGTIGGRF